jgi:hypothetical protein
MPSYAQDFLATLKLPFVSLKISLFRSNYLHGNKVYAKTPFYSISETETLLPSWLDNTAASITFAD